MNPSFVSQHHQELPALWVEGQPPITYADLNKAVSDFSQNLRIGDLVLLIGDNNTQSIICYLACLRSGAVPMLLGEGVKETVNRLIEIYDPELVFRKMDEKSLANEEIIWESKDHGLFRRPSAKVKHLHPSLALLLATSGTTGSPKLVKLSHQNLESNAQSIASYLAITPTERAITSLPFQYSFGLSVINSHLISGASLVLSNYSLLDLKFWNLVNQYSVSSISGVPYSYEILLKLRLERINMPTIKTLTQAGGKLAVDKTRKISEFCKGKGIDFYTMYGQTEATARMAFLSPKNLDTKAGSIGRAIPGGKLSLIDDLGEQITVPNTLGEIIYEGPNVSMGYADNALDLATQDQNKGRLSTGDIGIFDEDGFYYIKGRKNRFLKVFGIRLDLDSVEELVASKGLDCAAHGKDDALSVTIESSANIDANELRASLAQTLNCHFSAIKINLLENLPRLTTGKVDYQCLNNMQ